MQYTIIQLHVGAVGKEIQGIIIIQSKKKTQIHLSSLFDTMGALTGFVSPALKQE